MDWDESRNMTTRELIKETIWPIWLIEIGTNDRFHLHVWLQVLHWNKYWAIWASIFFWCRLHWMLATTFLNACHMKQFFNIYFFVSNDLFSLLSLYSLYYDFIYAVQRILIKYVFLSPVRVRREKGLLIFSQTYRFHSVFEFFIYLFDFWLIPFISVLQNGWSH